MAGLKMMKKPQVVFKVCPECNKKSVGMWCSRCFPNGFEHPWKNNRRLKINQTMVVEARK
jgi:hypothetical protein